MEALLFTLDCVVIVAMVFMGLRDDRRPPGAPHTSLFRTRDIAGPDTFPAAFGPNQGWVPWEHEGGQPP